MAKKRTRKKNGLLPMIVIGAVVYYYMTKGKSTAGGYTAPVLTDPIPQIPETATATTVQVGRRPLLQTYL